MTKTSNQIVFFGNEKLATGPFEVQPLIKQAVIAAGFDIEQHVTGSLSDLKPHKAQLAVLAAYGRIIPQRVLDEFPLGVINVHPSLLPQYRGPTPIERAMLDNTPKTGVSIMQLTAKMDEGPLYKQKTVHLTGKEFKPELVRQLQQLGSELLVEVLPGIADGSLQPHAQPHPNRATYSRLISKTDGIIDWTKPADVIEREIRAYAGWPTSRTVLANREVTITKAHVLDYGAQVPHSSTEKGPGTIFITNKKELCVQCGENTGLVIELLKPTGKNEMSAKDFILGYGRHL